MGWLIGSAYGISAGLIIYGITQEIIAKEHQFTVLILWALFGLIIAGIGAWRGKPQ